MKLLTILLTLLLASCGADELYNELNQNEAPEEVTPDQTSEEPTEETEIEFNMINYEIRDHNDYARAFKVENGVLYISLLRILAFERKEAVGSDHTLEQIEAIDSDYEFYVAFDANTGEFIEENVDSEIEHEWNESLNYDDLSIMRK